MIAVVSACLGAGLLVGGLLGAVVAGNGGIPVGLAAGAVAGVWGGARVAGRFSVRGQRAFVVAGIAGTVGLVGALASAAGLSKLSDSPVRSLLEVITILLPGVFASLGARIADARWATSAPVPKLVSKPTPKPAPKAVAKAVPKARPRPKPAADPKPRAEPPARTDGEHE